MPRSLPLLPCLSAPGIAAIGITDAPAQPTLSTLSSSDRAAAFGAAGFSRRGGQWRGDCDDPDGATYMPGTIETVGDLNGDGEPEVVITEGSSFCYGMAGTGFALVSRQDGAWKVMAKGRGTPTFLDSRGEAGWPDVQIGGHGSCLPVWRWDGQSYAGHRHQYRGKPCRR